jgi:hypothetical protein
LSTNPCGFVDQSDSRFAHAAATKELAHIIMAIGRRQPEHEVRVRNARFSSIVSFMSRSLENRNAHAVAEHHKFAAAGQSFLRVAN